MNKTEHDVLSSTEQVFHWRDEACILAAKQAYTAKG